jgi:hypothetical protein
LGVFSQQILNIPAFGQQLTKSFCMLFKIGKYSFLFTLLSYYQVWDFVIKEIIKVLTT